MKPEGNRGPNKGIEGTGNNNIKIRKKYFPYYYLNLFKGNLITSIKITR